MTVDPADVRTAGPDLIADAEKARKLQFATWTRQSATLALQEVVKTFDCLQTYEDRQYGPGGQNEITDDDLMPTSAGMMYAGSLITVIKAQDLLDLMTLITQIKLLLAGKDIIPGPYMNTMSRVRIDH